MAKEPRLYTTKEICVRTGLTQNNVLNNIRRGKLMATKKDNRYYVTEHELGTFLEGKNNGELLFGVIAIEMGFVSYHDVYSALAIQRFEDSRLMPHKLIGEILFDNANISIEQVDFVLEEQGNAAVVE